MEMEGKMDDLVEAACLAYWPLHWKDHIAEGDKQSIRQHMKSAIEAAVLIEQERYARIADSAVNPKNRTGAVVARSIATAIRQNTRYASSEGTYMVPFKLLGGGKG